MIDKRVPYLITQYTGEDGGEVKTDLGGLKPTFEAVEMKVSLFA